MSILSESHAGEHQKHMAAFLRYVQIYVVFNDDLNVFHFVDLVT
jgi:hypothetical protein